MPLPLVPIAGLAVRYGAVALVAYGLRRALRAGRTDQRAEDVMDDTEDGLALHRPADRGQTNAAARFRRTLRIGEKAYEVDFAALARFRVRKV